MEYNTSREPLKIPEYGRMIQDLVNYCKSLESKEERTIIAKMIIRFMGQKNPNLKDDEGKQSHKLWDHLFIIANYNLDIDSPFPIPSPDEIQQKPKKMDYPELQGEYKFYGKSILQLISKALELPSSEEKDILIELIANNMKKAYNVYNKEHVQDDVIFRHLKELSNHQLDLGSINCLEKSKIYFKTNKTKKKQQNNFYKKKNNSKTK